MAKYLVIIYVMCCCAFNTQAQQHGLIKQWDKTFGGNLVDGMWSFIQTSDGGYLLGGGANSGISGDKTQNNWDTTYNTFDYWVIKTDSLGNKEWDKRFGGYSNDGIQPSCLLQTSDGGYLISGQSSSGIGGNKTEACRGGNDFWMIKIDAVGNMEWDKTFGGTSNELLYGSVLTLDGGYILGGISYSGISGDKTQDSRGNSDYWVVKTDATGNKLWDKRFGGYDQDFLYAIQASKDGGYILGGISRSDTGGDKTQSNWAVGWYNFWVVKIDSTGSKQWDKVYGGTEEDDLESIVQTRDGGFLLAGYSYSNIGGNKSENVQGGYDYWIVKIDSVGNKEWDKDYGGSADDQLFSVSLTNDGGYLLAGNSASSASGDKSESNTVIGSVLTWLIKTDSLGNKQWDKTVWVNGGTTLANAFQTNEGCYAIGTFTPAEAGYYKTQNSRDSSVDNWIILFCDTTITGINDIRAEIQYYVYPNPFTSNLNIILSKPNLKEADFSICNMLGQTVYTQHETNLSPTYTKMLDLNYLPNCVYMVEVVVDGEVSVKEVIKQ